MRSVPFWPRVLGLAGLLPQIGCAAILWLGPEEWREPAIRIAALYAALILSFLGGMWWGIAAGAPAAERRRALRWLWIAAVLPSLVALGCLLPWVFGWSPWPEPSLVMLASALLVSLGVDSRLVPLAPRWWLTLRVPLSLGLAAATFLCGLA